MSTNLLPIALDLHGKPCLVVGAGAVAARKSRSLIDCGAVITIIAPVISEQLEELEEHCTIHRRPFEATDCQGQHLVFACTDSREVNEAVTLAAHAAGAWCNVADGGESDFQVMAAVRTGPVTIGISTGGGSPALARHLKDRIAEAIGPEYGVLAELLASRRAALKAEVVVHGERADLWREVLASNVLDLLRENRIEDAECLINEILEKFDRPV
jgi:precorrin-2 dehydrogenase/sirohydrochlorin ferrochelatase